MSKTIIFDGRQEAEKIKAQLRQELGKTDLKLAILLVGSNHGSHIYVQHKQATATQLGLKTDLVKLEKFAESKIIEQLEAWSKDDQIGGIMIQLPLPGATTTQTRTILNKIPLTKDVDGLNPENLILMETGEQTFLPATVAAVEHTLNLAGAFEWAGEGSWAVVGAKGMVGKALLARLKCLKINTLALDQGDSLEQLTNCPVIISATGVPGLIVGSRVQTGAIVIDVGFPKGDVDFESVSKKAGFITPVPGGIGPLTVVMLLKNMVIAVNERKNDGIVAS